LGPFSRPSRFPEYQWEFNKYLFEILPVEVGGFLLTGKVDHRSVTFLM
jgi:hypothetical protein